MSAQDNFGTYLCRVLLAGSLITVAGCSKPDTAPPEKTLAPVVTAPQREAILPIPPDGYVTVMRGETLYTIAARYQVSPLAIIEDNQLEAPFIIGAGQQLKTHATTLSHGVSRRQQRLDCRALRHQRGTARHGKWQQGANEAGHRPAAGPAGRA